MSGPLKEKFTRQITNAERRPVEHAEVHPETGIDLLLECLPFDSRDPALPRRRPDEMPDDLQFMGVQLHANELVPRGEMWLHTPWRPGSESKTRRRPRWLRWLGHYTNCQRCGREMHAYSAFDVCWHCDPNAKVRPRA